MLSLPTHQLAIAAHNIPPETPWLQTTIFLAPDSAGGQFRLCSPGSFFWSQPILTGLVVSLGRLKMPLAVWPWLELLVQAVQLDRLTLFWSYKESVQFFTNKHDGCFRFFFLYMLLIKLNEGRVLSNALSVRIDIIMWLFFFRWSIRWIILIHFLILNQACIPGLNPACHGK